jgi:hypothetical protein
MGSPMACPHCQENSQFRAPPPLPPLPVNVLPCRLYTGFVPTIALNWLCLYFYALKTGRGIFLYCVHMPQGAAHISTYRGSTRNATLVHLFTPPPSPTRVWEENDKKRNAEKLVNVTGTPSSIYYISLFCFCYFLHLVPLFVPSEGLYLVLVN